MQYYPQFVGIYFFPAGYLYGPLIWIHFLAVSGKEVKPIQLLHFIPFLVVLFLMRDILLMDGLTRIEYLSSNFYTLTMNMNYARAGHLLIYGIALLVFLYKNRLYLNAREKLYEISLCTIYFLSAVLINVLTEFASGWRDFIYYYFTIYTLVLLIAYLLYTNPSFLKNITRKYLSSAIAEEDMSRIQGKIREVFKKDFLFLKGDLSLANVAEMIDEKSHHISQTLSVKLDRNFNDYVNYERIEYAKKLLHNPEFEHFKIEAIAIESGFNNKVTFNKAFQKFTGVTPSNYKSLKG